jgi:hypothetical protein
MRVASSGAYQAIAVTVKAYDPIAGAGSGGNELAS